MDGDINIHKAAGVLIENRKLLVTRTEGKNFFIAPGGKVEAGETVTDALVRELKEELSITVHYDNFHKLDTYYAEAAGEAGAKLQMEVFMIEDWDGELTPSAEVAQMKWVDSKLAAELELGSIFTHEVIPALKERNLID